MAMDNLNHSVAAQPPDEAPCAPRFPAATIDGSTRPPRGLNTATTKGDRLLNQAGNRAPDTNPFLWAASGYPARSCGDATLADACWSTRCGTARVSQHSEDALSDASE
jgi:hypothetical protein